MARKVSVCDVLVAVKFSVCRIQPEKPLAAILTTAVLCVEPPNVTWNCSLVAAWAPWYSVAAQ